ncbi:MAG: VanW family protein [Candidatus Kerfeldbacteria bacterium]
MFGNKKSEKKSEKKADSVWNKKLIITNQAPAWVIILLFFLILAGLAIISFVFLFDSKYQEKVYPGTTVAGINAGGFTYEQLREKLEVATNDVRDQGLNFIYDGQQFTIKSSVGDLANPELSTELFSYDIEKTITELIKINNRRSEAEKIYYWLTGWEVTPIITIDQEKLVEVLSEELSQYEQPAVEAALRISEDYELTISSEKGGQAFNYEKIITEVYGSLMNLLEAPVVVILENDQPEITKTDAEAALGLVNQALSSTPYTLVYDEMSWEVDKALLREWLQFAIADGEVSIGLHKEKLTEYLEAVANEIDVEVKEAKFQMENGKVLEFQPSQNGRVMQVDDSAELFNQKIRQIGVSQIDLIVLEEEPSTKTSELNDMGIVELIGEGRSNFSGSPANRRHNIAIGADSVNGTLIAPGETFSLVKTLGNIDKAGGYLPELVIKGNQTIPEYGGGLCQVGTTTFRSVLNAGLNITERKNHSYRVSYYEPAGTDATIYDPAPDFKFVNDTENHVLFNTEIDGSELIFRIYGTKDGRKVEQTYPRIYNIVKPGPTKLIETTDLAPGVKKCTESAHAGADAEFTHSITYASGETKVDVYRSHYKPWQAVCLIGVEEKVEEPETTEE